MRFAASESEALPTELPVALLHGDAARRHGDPRC
jgi:hypothetical protein